jgi:hypothetical protein
MQNRREQFWSTWREPPDNKLENIQLRSIAPGPDYGVDYVFLLNNCDRLETDTKFGTVGLIRTGFIIFQVDIYE